MTTDRYPRRTSGLVVVAAVLLASVCVSACGSSAQSLDGAKIERAIAKSILNERGLHATVACPTKIPQKAGHVFTCAARLDVGTYPVTVTETDGAGQVRYQDERPLVVLNIARVQRAIEASVLSQRRLHATASCPAEVLQQAGLVFRCTAVIAGGTRRYPFSVSEVDSAGHVRYLGL
ncbi:MAG: DUF4333 domain-containing protein [Solirubrobacteraceae bacterium]